VHTRDFMHLLVVDCSCLGRMQSFISQLLHVIVGEAEQPLSTVPAGVGCAANWKVTATTHKTCVFKDCVRHMLVLCYVLW